MLERCKDILTPNWAFLPDVIKKPKKELKRKLLSHSLIQCDGLPYPYSIEKSFSMPVATVWYTPTTLGLTLWGVLSCSVWTWSKLSSWPKREIEDHLANEGIGRKNRQHILSTENYLFVWWNIKGISSSHFVSLLASCRAALPLCRTRSFWAGAYAIFSVNDPSFCRLPSLTPLFHSSPSPCQFPQHVQSFPFLAGFLKPVHFCSSHCNHRSSHHHYLHSGLL